MIKNSAKDSAMLQKAAYQMQLSKRSLYRYLKDGTATIESIRTEMKKYEGVILLKATTVAKLLACPRSSVYRWAIDEGKIPYIMLFEKSFRIRKDDLEEVLMKYYNGLAPDEKSE